MGFREAAKALANPEAATVEIDGQSFTLRIMSTAEALSLQDIKTPQAQAVALFRIGLVIEDDITDEEILALPAYVSEKLTDAINEHNRMGGAGEQGN